MRTNSKPKLGVDIDGVVFDQILGIASYIKTKYGYTIIPSQITQFDLTKFIPISHKQLYKMFCDRTYTLSLQPIPGARETLQYLSHYFWIELVSSRPNLTYDDTMESLHYHSIPYDMMFLGINDKPYHAKTNSIEYFIEDRWKTAQNLSKSLTRVFLMDSPWNKNRENTHSNLTRVHNWTEIRNALDSLGLLKSNIALRGSL